MRRRSLAPAAVALFVVVLAACHPLKDPPPAAPTPPPLPAAPGGIAVNPAVLQQSGHPDQALGAPDPDVISVDPSWCTLPPPPDPTHHDDEHDEHDEHDDHHDDHDARRARHPPRATTRTRTPTFRFVPTGVPVYRSTDLVHWQAAGPDDGHGHPSGIAFDGNVTGAEFPLWAPSVLQTGAHRFVMWFAEKQTCVGQMCLWSATSTNPDGPFTVRDGPVLQARPGRA